MRDRVDDTFMLGIAVVSGALVAVAFIVATPPRHPSPHRRLRLLPPLPARPTTASVPALPDSSSPARVSTTKIPQSTEETHNNPPRGAPLINDLVLLVPLLNRRPLINPFLLLNSEEHRLSLVKKQLSPIRVPHPHILALLKSAVLEEVLVRDEDLTREVQIDHNALRVAALDASIDNLAAEGAEHSEAEFSVDVDQARAVADEAFGCGEQVPEGDAETDAGDDFVAVFGVDGVFYGLGRGLAEVLRFKLNQVLYRALWGVSRGHDLN